VNVQNILIIYQFLLWPRKDAQIYKPRKKSENFGIQNTNLLTGFFIDIIKTDPCFS